MQIKTFKEYCPTHESLYEDILKQMLSINETYVGYARWYRTVFLSGVATQLMRAAIDELGGRPLIAVFSRHMFQLKPLLSRGQRLTNKPI